MANVPILATGLTVSDAPPLRVVRARGSILELDDGRELIDAGNTSAPLGHGHPALTEALRKAAGSPIINEGMAWHGRDEAASALVETVFGVEADWVGAVRFCFSGSEANDLALSLAQALTGREKLAARERAYHGSLGLARSVTRQPHWHGGLSAAAGGVKPVAALAAVEEVPGPEAVMSGQGRIEGDSFKDVAAVIVDYSQGGVYGNGEYQDSVAAAAGAAGALWIADEVVTGLGRSGRWLCLTRGSARPDMVTLGKPLGGGSAPVAALVVSRRVMEEMEGHSWQSYGTFRGHPLLVSTIPPTLDVLKSEGLVDRSAELGKSIASRFAEMQDRHPSVKSFDGLGMHWTVELHGGDWRTWRADTAEAPIASAVSAAALEQGVLIPTSGEQDSLFLAPPLNIDEDDLDRILTVLDAALGAADRELEARE